MNPMSDRAPIKFDFQSTRESFFVTLAAISIAIAFIVFIFASDGKNKASPANFDVIATGFIIGFSGFVIFGLLRLFTDDHLLVDPKTEHILLSTGFFFFKTKTPLCPFKEVKYIKLDAVRRSVKSGELTDFFLNLVMKHDQKRSCKTVSIPEMPGYQFNDKAARLRDKAVEIAAMIGCNVKYSDKIPPKERLQPKKLSKNFSLEKQNLPVMPSIKKSKKATEIRNEITETRNEITETRNEIIKIPMDKIESDFLYYDDSLSYEEDKICPSCGGKNSQTEYCINCGRIL